MPIVGVDHVQLAMPAGREPEARAFYAGLLGIPELTKPPTLALRRGLVRARPGQDPPGRGPRLPSRAKSPPVDDPFGNRLELMEPRSAA